MKARLLQVDAWIKSINEFGYLENSSCMGLEVKNAFSGPRFRVCVAIRFFVISSVSEKSLEIENQ